MKIAIYVVSWPPGFVANGIVTYASHIVPALRRLGHEVFVLTPYKTSEENDPYIIDLRNFAPTFLDKVRFRICPDAASFVFASSAITTAVSQLVKTQQLDIFEMEEAFGLSFAISRRRLLPVILRLHGPWFLTGNASDVEKRTAVYRRRVKLEGRGIEHASFVTAPSNAVLQSVKKYYDLRLPASRVVPNPLEAIDEAETWNLKTCDSKKLLFIGRFDALKGGDLVLRAFAELAASDPQLRLTFVGPDNGLKTDGGNTQHFEQFMESNFPQWVRQRVDFRGQMAHTNVMRLRSKHFATMVASQEEVFPYSVLEAMSVGCPLVATAVGGIPELITDQRNGLLVPSQNVTAMVAACRKLSSDHSFAARLGRQAWLDCGNYYKTEKFAIEF